MENPTSTHNEPIRYSGHPALVDVAVLILFFNRPNQLSQVFEW